MTVKTSFSLFPSTTLGELKVVSLNPSKEDIVVNPVGTHYVQVIDRSGSMSGSLNDLIEDIKKTYDELSSGDFLSVLWYSGSGDYGSILRGYEVKKSKSEMENIGKMLDPFKRTVGCTVFSQVLQDVKTLVRDFTTLQNHQFSISFFTDGQLVPDHQSRYEERKQVIQLCKELGSDSNVMAINTIGYGSYYDTDLLNEMSNSSLYGTFTHSTNIKDYHKIFMTNATNFAGTLRSNIVIIPDTTTDVFIATTKTMTKHKVVAGERLNINFVPKDGVRVICKSGNITIENNGVTTVASASDFKTAIRETQTVKYNYGIASCLATSGDRDTALDILINEVADENLVKMGMRAFAVSEVGDYVNEINKAYKSTKTRSVGSFDKSILSRMSFNQMLNVLAGTDTFVDVSDMRKSYKRRNYAGIDKTDTFVETKNQLILTSIDNISYPKDKFNINLSNTMINGKVEIAPEHQELFNGAKKLDCSRFKTYTLVFNGELNITSLKLLVTKDVINSLRSATDGYLSFSQEELTKKYVDFLKNKSTEENELSIDDYVLVTISNLEEMPLINRELSKSVETFTSISNKVDQYELLSAQASVLKYLANSVAALSRNTVKVTPSMDKYTVEQIKVLKEVYGISTSGLYTPKVEKITEGRDYYEVRSLEFFTKGLSSSAKVEESIDYEPKGSRISVAKEFMKQAYDMVISNLKLYDNLDLSDLSKINKNYTKIVRLLNERMKTVNLQKSKLATELSIIKLSKGLTGGWFKDLPLDPEKDDYEVSVGMKTYTIKVKYTKQYI